MNWFDMMNIGDDIMFLPKIRFREMTLEENIEVIKWAYFEDNGALSVHDFTVKYFPELANLDPNLSRDKVYKVIEEVVTSDYNKYKESFYNTLSSLNIIFFPLTINLTNVNEIVATVGLIPVFPRYLDSFSFSVSTGVNELKLLEVCAHETLHFLWFEKWKKIHPETKRREYDSPYLVWQYSEMVTDPILNNKPFSDMFDFNERGYDNFYEIDDNGCKVMDNLRKIYSKDISIEEKMNQGFEYINKVLNDKESVRITKK